MLVAGKNNNRQTDNNRLKTVKTSIGLNNHLQIAYSAFQCLTVLYQVCHFRYRYRNRYRFSISIGIGGVGGIVLTLLNKQNVSIVKMFVLIVIKCYTDSEVTNSTVYHILYNPSFIYSNVLSVLCFLSVICSRQGSRGRSKLVFGYISGTETGGIFSFVYSRNCEAQFRSNFGYG